MATRDLQSAALAALIATASGALLGALAWGADRVPAMAMLLPLLLAMCGSRVQSAVLAFAYSLGVLRFAPATVGGWFDGDMLIGWSAISLCAVATGAAWCAGWSPSRSPSRRALAMGGGWLAALLPPAALGSAGHPVIAVGFLLPGSGWLGVAISLGLALCAGAAGAVIRDGRIPTRLAAGGVAGVLAGAGLMVHAPSSVTVDPVVPGVVAVPTNWGRLTDEEQVLARIEAMGRERVPDNAHAVIWPESVIGLYRPSLYPVLEAEVLRRARAAGRTQVIGMDLQMPGERFQNAAVAFYPDGSTATAVARQPAPLSLWRPFTSGWSFEADWRAGNVLRIGEERAALVFCYEEYLPVLFLLNEIWDKPSAYLVLTNTWSTPDPVGARVQTLHSLGMARLFGRAFLKAENRPGKVLSQNWSHPVAP